MEKTLEKILELLNLMLTMQQRQTVHKTHYSVEEFSVLVDREPFTVREWCRRKRINAGRSSKCGPHARYVISHQEYLRWLRDGLLPLEKGPRLMMHR